MKENVCEALVSIMYNWIGIFSHSLGMAGIMDFHYIHKVLLGHHHNQSASTVFIKHRF